MTTNDSPTRLDDVDWESWRPTEHATLMFVIENGRILLIHKKRGLGRGKINGPGGRLDPGETARQAAIREIGEEVGVQPLGVREAGELSFQFRDGYGLHCTLFTASGHTGTPIETDEACPEWFPLDAIPYEQMWADDRLWMPHLLHGRRFTGRFIFDGDAMLDHNLQTC